MRLDRRTFLFGTAAATAFACRSTARAGVRELGPGERRRLALIGCGAQMRTSLIPQFLNREYAENVEIVVVCDCDGVRAAAAAEQVNRARRDGRKVAVVSDFREVLADPSIDAVCIATPDHWHAYMAVEAMKHGKDVYCETPLTFSVEEAKRVAEAAEKYDRVFQTGSAQRSLREFRDAVGLVRGGLIGEVRYVDANCAGDGLKYGGPPHPSRFYEHPEDAASEGAPNPDVDWDMWLGPARWRPYSDRLSPRGAKSVGPVFWRFDDDLGTGYDGDSGAHVFDIVQWGLDMDASGPCRVIRSAEPPSTDPLHGGRRQSGMRMQFVKDGRKIELYHGPFGLWSTAFFGTRGIVAVGRGRIAVWLGGRSADVKPDAAVRAALQDTKCLFAKEDVVVESVSEDAVVDARAERIGRLDYALDRIEMEYAEVLSRAALRFSPNQVQDFCACLESRRRPAAPAEVGARAAVLCHLCNAAYRYDASFDWDPVRLEIPGENRRGISLRREAYRAGWDVVV